VNGVVGVFPSWEYDCEPVPLDAEAGNGGPLSVKDGGVETQLEPAAEPTLPAIGGECRFAVRRPDRPPLLKLRGRYIRLVWRVRGCGG
jgi:hypothetical protein